eukprot:CAMPEP_0184292272 /NCGR_PEP_ID=MMETSP1049-20130417/4084_1 /TAXON_ID=77928 /ORGANISM="Proteomonas sulcata, Strain CCMP704" /LENGTH=110 /DNA_ID=CAMNT_0026599987 /DNA_START=1 /DNA_END=333 /DNA_ORIENTATION=-
MGSSIFDDSVYQTGYCDGNVSCEEGFEEKYDVLTFDVARLLRKIARPQDYIVLRMDIEGAEYEVVRRLITSGVACWINNFEFEGHAMYAQQNHKYRPVDGVSASWRPSGT